MITGVRLTQLANGEPLLDISFHYNDLNGIQAVEERLKDLFSAAKNLGFNYIIDTVKPQLDANGNLHLKNNGINGIEWPFERRMELYRLYKSEFGIDVLLEVEFPTFINESNWEKYADYFANNLVDVYGGSQSNDIKYWQVVVNPEQQDEEGNYKCDPVSYVKFLKHINYIRLENPDIKIGGPGNFQAVIDYTNDVPNNWLAKAIGDVYVPGDVEYETIEEAGFLSYIDFYSFHGKQNTQDMNYTKYSSIIEKIDTVFNKKIDRKILLFSTSQGWQINPENTTSLQEQGYYEVREILNAVKCGVVPFKNQLVDEYNDPAVWDGKYDPQKMNYGILYYYLGENGYKPAYNDYFFILKNLEGFDTVTTDINVYEANVNFDSVTLINNDKDRTATIVWPKRKISETIFLKPHYARQYMIPNSAEISLVDTAMITFDKINFVIVYQTVDKANFDVELLEQRIERKLTYAEDTLAHLIDLLPNSYNKEVTDTNYYKLLRALSLEISDAKIEVQELKDNLYLDDAKEESIYDNFGVLVNLKRQPEWDYEKYRRLVKGVTKSLLNGPTVSSIVDAVKLFTNFNVNIHELYKNENQFDSMQVNTSQTNTINTQFKFVIEIEKPIDVFANEDTIYRDANYVINIVKPAHTLCLMIITLAGEENYRTRYADKYGKEFKDSDYMEREMSSGFNEGLFGWRSKSYPGQLKTTGDFSVISNNSLTNSGLLIGPRYVLHDSLSNHLIYPMSDTIEIEIMENLYAELGYKEKYVKPKKDNVEFQSVLKEHKFGIDFDLAFQLNGGFINSTGELKTLYSREENDINYILGFTTKLKDESLFDVEFDENGIMPEPEQNYFKLNEGFLNQNKLFAKLRYETYEIRTDDDIETYHKVLDSYYNADCNLFNIQRLRTYTLSDILYHAHKKIIKVMESTNNLNILVPKIDIFAKRSIQYDSLTRVYVNGILIPYWCYEEIPSELDENGAIGIKIIPEAYEILPGDVINVIYQKDREVIISDFPFIENHHSNNTSEFNEQYSVKNSEYFMEMV